MYLTLIEYVKFAILYLALDIECVIVNSCYSRVYVISYFIKLILFGSYLTHSNVQEMSLLF